MNTIKGGITLKKIILKSIVTAIIISLIVLTASFIVPFSYSNWSFFIGLGISIILYLSNSSGGILSSYADANLSEATWKIENNNEQKVNVGIVFYGSVLYTVISFISMLIMYY